MLKCPLYFYLSTPWLTFNSKKFRAVKSQYAMLLILKPLSKSFYHLKSDPQNKMKQNIVVHAGLLHYMQLTYCTGAAYYA